MKSAFIIHDSYSNPDADWYPWLQTELEKAGYTVFRPKFPTPEHQSLQTWTDAFEPYIKNISGESIFVGHGIGNAFIFRLLEKVETPVHALILVAPFADMLEHQGLNLVQASFFNTPFAWKHIHEVMGDVHILASHDDPYISTVHSQQVADVIGVDMIVLENRGHFTNTVTVPEILESILTLEVPHLSPAQQATDMLQAELEHVGISIPNEARPHIISDEVTFPTTSSAGDVFFEKDQTSVEAITEADKEQETESVHTYYSDITNALDTAHTKEMANILRSEREHVLLEKKHKQHFILNIIYAVLTGTFVIAGIFFLLNSKPDTGPLSVEQEKALAPSLIRVDKQIPLTLSNRSIFDVHEALKNLFEKEIPALHDIFHMVPSLNNAGLQKLASPEAFLNSFEIRAPEKLLSSLDDEYMYGRYGGNEPYNFLLFNVHSFDNAFAGMKEWEKTIARDVQEMLALSPDVIHPTLYDQSFADVESHNYQMRVLRAPTWERIISAEEVEHLLPAAPRQHILPQEVLSTLESITDTTIVFSAPSEFLRSLRSGDVLIATATDTRSGFLRTMTGFSIDENNHLIIATTPAQASDLIPRAPSGNRIEKRIDVNGNPEYFYVTQEEVINYKEGPETTVMLYTFLSDHELLITTNEDVVDAVVERLGEKDVQK